MEPWLPIALAAFLAAGVIKGTLGVGLPIAAVGLMAQFIDPRIAMSLMVFPIMFTNIWQFYRAGNYLQCIKQNWLFALILPIALITTTFFTTQIPVNTLIILVGIVIIIFSAMNIAYNPPKLPDRYNALGQFIAAVLSGVFGGLTTIWSPLVAAYLIARKVDKEEFVRTSGFLFVVGSVPLAIGFWQNGLLTGSIATLSASMIIPTLAGFSIGEIIRRKLQPDRFRLIVLVFFVLIGLNLIRKGLTG